MAKVYFTTFKVSGEVLFPIDMLRYDGCFPASSMDSGLLGQTACRGSRGCPVAVKLRKVHIQGKGWRPASERWASFGWTVDLSSLVTGEVMG